MWSSVILLLGGLRPRELHTDCLQLEHWYQDATNIFAESCCTPGNNASYSRTLTLPFAEYVTIYATTPRNTFSLGNDCPTESSTNTCVVQSDTISYAIVWDTSDAMIMITLLDTNKWFDFWAYVTAADTIFQWEFHVGINHIFAGGNDPRNIIPQQTKVYKHS